MYKNKKVVLLLLCFLLLITSCNTSKESNKDKNDNKQDSSVDDKKENDKDKDNGIGLKTYGEEFTIKVENLNRKVILTSDKEEYASYKQIIHNANFTNEEDADVAIITSVKEGKINNDRPKVEGEFSYDAEFNAKGLIDATYTLTAETTINQFSYGNNIDVPNIELEMANGWWGLVIAKSFEEVSFKCRDFISLKANSGTIEIRFVDSSLYPNSEKKVNGWNSMGIYGIDIGAQINETATITFKYLDEGKFLLITPTKLTNVGGTVYGKDTVSYLNGYGLNDLDPGQYIIEIHDKNTVTATIYR